MTARNGPVPDHGSPVAGTPAAKASPSSATPDRARCRCPQSSPPGASGNSARAAPRARPSGPRNKAGSSPRQRRRSRPRSAPTASGHKTHDPESAASPTSSPSGPPDHPSAVPSPSANPPANQGTRESDGADLINGLLIEAPPGELDELSPMTQTGRQRRIRTIVTNRDLGNHSAAVTNRDLGNHSAAQFWPVLPFRCGSLSCSLALSGDHLAPYQEDAYYAIETVGHRCDGRAGQARRMSRWQWMRRCRISIRFSPGD